MCFKKYSCLGRVLTQSHSKYLSDAVYKTHCDTDGRKDPRRYAGEKKTKPHRSAMDVQVVSVTPTRYRIDVFENT